jgi:hypothetical protein
MKKSRKINIVSDRWEHDFYDKIVEKYSLDISGFYHLPSIGYTKNAAIILQSGSSDEITEYSEGNHAINQ